MPSQAARAAALASFDRWSAVAPSPTRRGTEAAAPTTNADAAPSPVLLVRFIGLTSEASRVPSLLFSLCTQLAAAFDLPPPRQADAARLPERWDEWLSLASAHRPIVLVLDGVERLEGAMQWLPLPRPPPYVRLLLTCAEPKADALRMLLPQGAQLRMCPPSRTTSDAIVSSTLGKLARRLQPAQRALVLDAAGVAGAASAVAASAASASPQSFCSSGGTLPLHLELLAVEAASWTSSGGGHGIPDDSGSPPLPRSAEETAHALFDLAESEHGVPIVAAACGLLCVARDGLSFAELLHVLSCCDDVLAPSFAAASRPPAQARLPPSALRLLLHLLARGLSETLVAAHGGAPLLRWRHSLLRDAAASRYCAAADGARWCALLAAFFSGVTPQPFPPFELNEAIVTLPADRGLPPQPLQDAPTHGPGRGDVADGCNRRALRELVAAMAGSGAWHAVAERLCSLEWLEAKLTALGVRQLLDDFELVTTAAAAHHDGALRGHRAALAQIDALSVALLEAAEVRSAPPKRKRTTAGDRVSRTRLPEPHHLNPLI